MRKKNLNYDEQIFALRLYSTKKETLSEIEVKCERVAKIKQSTASRNAIFFYFVIESFTMAENYDRRKAFSNYRLEHVVEEEAQKKK